jgi:N-acetylglucosamine-6-sulfatase
VLKKASRFSHFCFGYLALATFFHQLLFTDDQDLTIGGWDLDKGVMVQTQRIVGDLGATSTNWMIHTPICAPSRAELLSGRYLHNIKSANKSPSSALCGSGAVGQIDLEKKVYPYTFVEKLRVEKGYTTAQFGKLENSDNEGLFDDMRAFDRFFTGCNYQGGTYKDSESPTGSFNANKYHSGYGTSVIGNKTIEWLNKVSGKGRPWFVYFAPHAPHSPATPPAWYKDHCVNVTSPRTPAFDYIGKPGEFHNLINRQPPFDEKDISGIDALARKRCQCLLAVDDTYTGIIDAVEKLGELDKTYILVTSDHGYNLGQHRIPSNKFLLYDHSLKIPMLFKGPGIPKGTILDFLGTQVDLAPTMLGFAGIDPAPWMDGKSIVSLLVKPGSQNDGAAPIPASVTRHLDALKRMSVTDGSSAYTSADTSAYTPDGAPVRTASFHEYYNQGPWEVGKTHALDDW